MSQYQQLMQALTEQQTGYDQAYTGLQPLQRKMFEATTRSQSRGLPLLIETLYDSQKAKKVEPEYLEALKEAMASARGVDDIQAQIQALQAQAQLEDERNWEMYKGDYEHSRDTRTKKELQTQKDNASLERVKARGNPANVTYNIPSGYMPVDPNNPMAGVQPIPGSKEAMEMEQAEKVGEMKDASARAKYSSVLDEVEQAMGKVNNLTAGFVGRGISNIPGTDAYELSRHLDTIKGNLGFDRLQQMREESKTGGALGQVSNIELNLLTSSLTALDAGLGPDQLQRNLSKVQRHYQNFLDALSGKMPEGYDEAGNPVSVETNDVDALIQKYLN